MSTESLISNMEDTASTGSSEEKHLTFVIDGEHYGIRILQAQEIIGMQKVVSVPMAPDYIRGVLNLRGRILPVLDMRIKFGLRPVEDTERTCIVIISILDGQKRLTFGLVVDEVSEVVEIGEEDIQDTPYIESDEEDRYFSKVARLDDKVIMLLDLEKIILEQDKSLAEQVMREETGEESDSQTAAL